ncbi:MAG: FG-GAP repeat domain-containing protein [Terriglobales bacterium]
MKEHLALSMVVLLASLPGFGLNAQPGISSQLRIKQAHVTTGARVQTSLQPKPGPPAPPAGSAILKPVARAHAARPRPRGIAPAPAVGLVSADQLALGEDDGVTEAVVGDFNGDGKKDVAKLVYVAGIYQISVGLSNGDGTFQAARLTPTPRGSVDPILVGDVNGDGKDDLLEIHLAVLSTMDVLLSNGDGTFSAGANVPLSTFGLQGGVVVDVNGDGRLDVLTIDSENLARIAVVLGNGDGTFQAATTLARLSGPAPNQIFFADFNGDGKLDFAGLRDGRVQIYLASGSSFLAPVGLVTPDNVYLASSASAGDLNQDGKPDIVSVNTTTNSVTVYLNNGDGSFRTGVTYTNAGGLSTFPGESTIADVNGDGKNDIVVGDTYAGEITIFMGNGDGTLTAPTAGYAVGGFPWTAPLVDDFSGDGLADIIVPDDYFSLVHLRGYGDGTFRAALSYSLPQSTAEAPYTAGVAAADFNGDGLADVVATQSPKSLAPGVVVYLSNPDGTLQPGVNYGFSSTMSYVTVADFNGDGKPDIAATDSVNGLVYIFMGIGDGTFTTGSSYATDTADGPYPTNLVSGDFNDDGKVDLAIANGNSSTVGVLLGNGDGTFGVPASYPIHGAPYGIAAADLNRDGLLDLAVTMVNQNGSSVAVLLANNDGTRTFQPERDIATGDGSPEYLAFGDLNRDGKLDMAVSMIEGPAYPGAIVVALGNGDGSFQAPTAYPSSMQLGGLGFSYPTNVRMIDFDGDGNLDLIYDNHYYGTVGILYGKGNGTFFDPIEFITGGYIWGLALADVNGDGALDVITGSYYSGGVNVALNNSGSGTLPSYTLGANSAIASVAAGASATYDLSLTGRNGYNGTITFACSGLPSHAACSFSPASVVVTGNIPVATTLTVATSAASAHLMPPVRPNNRSLRPTFLANPGALGVLGLMLAGGGKKRNRRQMAILLGIMLLAMAFSTAGCGGSNSPASSAGPGREGTPPGSYAVVVTATGSGTGAPTHSMNLTLVVQ